MTQNRAELNRNLAQMLKGGVIMDVTTPEQAKIAQDAGACAVMALERIPADIRAAGGVSRMSDPAMIKGIQEAVSIPVMAKVRIGHIAEARILQAIEIDYIDESEVLSPADDVYHIDKNQFDVPFVCGAKNLGEALRRIAEGAAMIRTKGEPGTGDVIQAVRHMRTMNKQIRELVSLRDDEVYEVAKQLAASGLSRSSEGAWRRVIIEKPFGHDLASAKELDSVVSEVFDPSSVFRIDHYLGKETVQNLLALRFANAMYEPIWNANYVDHVQITMAEDIGIGGRAGYYDGIGAARDVIQNHLLQLMALTAMEEPVSFTAKDLTAEKTKVLSAVRLPKDLAANTARGQYAKGWQGSHEVVGYLEEKGIDPKSTTQTYAAIRLDIDTRRWAGVPFYLRCGKRLGKRVTEIAVVFKLSLIHI